MRRFRHFCRRRRRRRRSCCCSCCPSKNLGKLSRRFRTPLPVRLWRRLKGSWLYVTLSEVILPNHGAVLRDRDASEMLANVTVSNASSEFSIADIVHSHSSKRGQAKAGRAIESHEFHRHHPRSKRQSFFEMIRATHDDCNGRLGLFYLVHGATLHGFNRPNRRPDIRDGFGYGLLVVRSAAPPSNRRHHRRRRCWKNLKQTRRLYRWKYRY